MPPRSPDNPFHDLFTPSPSTPPAPNPAPTSTTTGDRFHDDQPLPPGTMVRYLWTCHLCGCGSFRCDDASVALCVQCAHAVCDGCTTFFGARLLDYVDAEILPDHVLNPGCTCEHPSRMDRCRSSNPVRRCPAASGLRRLRYSPYARPTYVQHCVVAFRPGRDGRPALGTFFSTRPRFERPSASRTPHGTENQTLNCITRSVATARAVSPTIIPPIHEVMLRQPRIGDPSTVPVGIPVCTVALARFFAAGAASVARALGVDRHPVVSVRVDPMLAFVAYYLCASFCAALAAWKGRVATARQPSRAAPE